MDCASLPVTACRRLSLKDSQWSVSLSALSRLFVLLAVFLGLFASAAQAQIPPTPSTFTWITGHSQVTLNWSASAGATSYKLYKGTTPGGETLYQTLGNVQTFTDTGLTNGTPYYYQVSAVNANGESARTAELKATPNVHVNSGGTASFTDSGGVFYAADTGFAGGSILTTANPIANTTDDPLYQAQREGPSFSYSFTGLPNGFYSVTLLFAEIHPGAAAGQNVFNITLNTRTVATGFDIFAQAGGANKAITRSYTVNITANTLSLSFAKTVGTAALAGIAVGPPPAPPASVSSIAPGWASEQIPSDGATGAGGNGAGPGSSMSVDLTSLASENAPGADIAAYNPVGPSVAYARMYRSSLVTDSIRTNAPGLSPGWTDNYDLQLTSANASTWSNLTLRYPNGSAETLTVTTPGGVPTIAAPAGAPYLVNGTPSGTVGQWSDITITFKDRSSYGFTPPPGAGATNTLYLFTRITNLVERFVTINRDTSANGYRVTSIANDAGTPLLQFVYTGSVLANVQDVSSPNAAERRKVVFNVSGGLLIRASQIVALTSGTAPDRWQYTYQTVAAQPYLYIVGCPNPAGGGIVNGLYYYDASALTRQMRDAKTQFRSYLPDTGGVQVNGFNVSGSLAEAYLQRVGPPAGGGTQQVNTGFTDYLGKTATVARTNATNKFLPTSVTNRNGKTWTPTYDSIGNVLTLTSPRGVKVTNTYDYGSSYPLGTFTLGQLQTSQTTNGSNSLIGTTFTYFTTAPLRGLVKDVTSPKPGTTFPGSQVTISYTYTTLGNVATITNPGPNPSFGTQTITFNYGASEKLGQPLTVTVSGPDAVGATTTQTTTYTYDGRGNVLSMTDASGNKTDYAYNLADQVVTVQQPATGETGAGRVTTTNAYQYPGGSLTSVTLSDESGTAVRQVNYTYTAEGEVASVTGSTQPVSYVYDGAGRATRLTDGNAHNTYYLYNLRGDLLQTQYPGSGGGGVTLLAAGTIDTLSNTSFDDDQNLLQSVDGRGITTNYTRNADPENFVTAVGYAGVPGGMTANPLGFTYDVWGRLSGRTDGVTGQSGTPKTYAYDDLGSPLSITTNFVSGPQGQVISYTYNDDGSRFQMGTPAGTFSYQYDGVSRLTKASFPWLSGSVTYSYQANGWMQTAKTPRFLTTYTRNPRGLVTRLLNQTVLAPVTNISDFTGMTYDAAGNRFGLTATIPANGSAPAATRSQTFAYDTNYPGSPQSARDVLLTETSTSSGNAYGQQYTWNFGYDSAYNANTMRSAAVAHNSDNQRTTPYNGGSFAYDGNGNPTTYASATSSNFSFDVLNRLTGIVTPAFTASYGADGLRATRTTTSVGTLYFLYDEAGDATTPLIEETFSGGTTTVAAAIGVGADGVRSRYYTGIGSNGYNGWFYVYDPQGNTVQRTTDFWNRDTNLLFYDTSLYDSYGFLLKAAWTGGNQNSPHRDAVGFGGQWGYYTDYDTTLLCLTHRYYDPATGRFVNRDPIGYDGGINLYTFAGGNPVNRIDPSGLILEFSDFTFDEFIAIKLAIAQIRLGGPKGRQLIDSLIDSPVVYHVRPTDGDPVTEQGKTRRDGSYIYINPSIEAEDKLSLYVDESPSEAEIRLLVKIGVPEDLAKLKIKPTPLRIQLVHEFGHAVSRFADNEPGQTGASQRMVIANLYENPIRREQGLPLRARYGTPLPTMGFKHPRFVPASERWVGY